MNGSRLLASNLLAQIERSCGIGEQIDINLSIL